MKLHSISDIITNSSTTIYTTTHGKSIEIIKQFIDSVLKETGSTKKAEDLYYFQEIYTKEAIERLYDSLSEEGLKELTGKCEKDFYGTNGYTDYKIVYKIFYSLDKDVLNEAMKKIPNYDYSPPNEIKIASKTTGEEISSYVFLSIFEQEASYDG